MAMKKLKVNDKVKRSGAEGCVGVVKDIRAESISSSANEERDRPLMVTVLWDNGTISVFAPEALEPAK